MQKKVRAVCERAVAGLVLGTLIALPGAACADPAGTADQAVSLAAPESPDHSFPGFTASSRSAQNPPRSFLSGVADKAGQVVVSALNMIGVRYRWGGNTPDSGLDCSGFVAYVFQDTLGMKLPRRAVEMSRVGEKVSMGNLKPGDLVFFNTVRHAVSHVGIYIGDHKFVHSPSTGSTIRVDELDNGYWEKRFTGARRIEVKFSQGDALRQRADHLDNDND